MPSVTPRLDPLSIALNDPDWESGIVLYDLDLAERLATDILNAVKLLRYHVARQKGGAATKGISTPAKRRAARRNGRRGGRSKTSA